MDQRDVKENHRREKKARRILYLMFHNNIIVLNQFFLSVI